MSTQKWVANGLDMALPFAMGQIYLFLRSFRWTFRNIEMGA